MDKDLFLRAIEKVSSQNMGNGAIGTLSEKTVHAVVKEYFEGDRESQEVKLGSFYADIVGEDGIIEIQTRDLYRLKEKLKYFLAVSNVTIVHPIPHTKYLSWINTETGEITEKRKSPKLGKPWDAFRELYGIKDLLSHPRLSICLLLIDVVEYRNLDGWGNGGKRGSRRNDRIPTELFDEIYLNCPEDYFQLVPPNSPEEFTVKDFEKLAKTTPRNSAAAVNVLCHIGIFEKIGKKGRSYLYRLKTTDNKES